MLNQRNFIVPILGKHREADEAVETLSPAARSLLKSKAHVRSWRALVQQVGIDQAIEHIEVRAMMVLLSSAEEAVSLVLEDLRQGVTDDDETLLGLFKMGAHMRSMTTATREQLLQISTRQESLDIAQAGSIYALVMFKAATDPLMTTPAGDLDEADRAAVQQSWEDARARWDEATGRLQLYLVGQPPGQ